MVLLKRLKSIQRKLLDFTYFLLKIQLEISVRSNLYVQFSDNLKYVHKLYVFVQRKVCSKYKFIIKFYIRLILYFFQNVAPY